MLLEGTRVVEMGVWVAAPSAGGILADWGADVIKVEPPAGDPMRELFQSMAGMGIPESPPFDLDNRGKRSIVVETRTEEGRSLVRRLVKGADVFLTNLRPGALSRMGLDPKTLRREDPGLVYASVSGYGLEGPERDRAAYDVGAFWARAGAAHQFAPADAEPPSMRGGFGDHVAGLATVSGILAALLERQRTGRGRLVETSLLRTGIYCLGWDFGIQLRFGKVARAAPRTEPQNPLLNSYRAADGRWFFLICLEADRHWSNLVAVLEQPELEQDERFRTARARRKNGGELVKLLDRAFAEHPLEDWATRFDRHDLWWSPVRTPQEVVADPQALAAQAFVEVPGIDGSTAHRAVATPVRFDGTDPTPKTPPPRLGEHGTEVLREAGLSDAEIAALRDRGAIP
jgi:crotonobetainyl-CoA:carnitine CoA-transferase CaiB-like acyl-CoA transferase